MPTIGTIIAALAVLLIAGLALRSVIKRRRAGGCAGCDHCEGCPHCELKGKE
ncbi:hypothetical protein FACS1894184_01420 [Clostridia bacterium]|nr:hypothetical protein FACS1894184_01420 [Clostridia bacterium]